MPYKILVAEDDEAVASLIAITLKTSNHEVLHAIDGRAAEDMIGGQDFDLALVDIMLPYVDGYALLERLKQKGIPTIFITAKVQLADKVLGLRLGAEDYITKPFEPLELLARVDTALRRTVPRSSKLAYLGITLDMESRVVTKSDCEIALTKIEYELLALFFQNPRLVFSRNQLLDRIWGFDYAGGSRTVDMHIKRLRAKLDCAEIIETIHGIGYRLNGDHHHG